MAYMKPFHYKYSGQNYTIRQRDTSGNGANQIVASLDNKSASVSLNADRLEVALRSSNKIPADKNFTWLITGNGNDSVTKTNGSTWTYGGNDKIYALAKLGTGQHHVYAGDGSDHIRMKFHDIPKNTFSHGHHAFGDSYDYSHRNKSKITGKDKFEFNDLHNVKGHIVGRIDDYDPSRDKIVFDGHKVDLNNLGAMVRATKYVSAAKVVKYNGDIHDSNAEPQNWLMVKTLKGGILMYAIDGARVDMSGKSHHGGDQEAHFIAKVNLANLWNKLPAVRYVDPKNYVPDGHKPDGGTIIFDTDTTIADVKKTISGTSKGDLISAGLNNDTVRAGGGNDKVWGGDGHDKIYGDDGNDTLWGNFGKDVIYGGKGSDRLYGDYGNDTLYGENDNDRLYGYDGNDFLAGGNGNDRLYGQGGNDRLYGGNGNDYLRDEEGRNHFDGGPGVDTVSYYGLKGRSGIKANLETRTSNKGDTFKKIENLEGSKFTNDYLTGSAKNNKLMGLNGNDTLDGGRGNDVLIGGSGRDRFVFNKGDGDDTVTDYRDGQDKIVFGGGVSWNSISISSHSKGTLIEYGNDDSILLNSVSPGQLTQSDFIFG